MQLLLAEKPSVARDLARVLGIPARGTTHFEGKEQLVTWCVGHLAELEEPGGYDARWRAWREDTLPMIPERFRLRPSTHAPAQVRAVRALLRDKRVHEVVNACDAGREGELIFRYVYELSACKLPVRRLWVSSLTDEALEDGLRALRPGRDYDALADAARCRSEADWLVGLNATRALTLRARSAGATKLLSLGRVQTPTLAMVAERERELRAFVPQPFWSLQGDFRTSKGVAVRARWEHQGRSRLATEPLGESLRARCEAHARREDPQGPRVQKVERKRVHEAAPQLFDLTTLQRVANKRFGWSAQHTLELAQSLYEARKVLTYPRTDSRHLSTAVAATLPSLWSKLGALGYAAPHAAWLAKHARYDDARTVDDAQVSDHHAIVPTGKVPAEGSLGGEEAQLFELVVRRTLAAFLPAAAWDHQDVVVLLESDPNPSAATPEEPRRGAEKPGPETPWTTLPPGPEHFHLRGRALREPGWRAVDAHGDGAPATRGEGAAEAVVLPVLAEGERLDGSFSLERGETRPPPRFTDASLLGAMEYAGRRIEDAALRRAMRDCGLGTPATRASTLETLLDRGYLVRRGRTLEATKLGELVVGSVPVPALVSAALTGEWEQRLRRVERGEESREQFMGSVRDFVRSMVESFRKGPSPSPGGGAVGSRLGVPCPSCRAGELLRGHAAWGCTRFREGCALRIPFENSRGALSEETLRELVLGVGELLDLAPLLARLEQKRGVAPQATQALAQLGAAAREGPAGARRPFGPRGRAKRTRAPKLGGSSPRRSKAM